MSLNLWRQMKRNPPRPTKQIQTFEECFVDYPDSNVLEMMTLRFKCIDRTLLGSIKMKHLPWYGHVQLMADNHCLPNKLLNWIPNTQWEGGRPRRLQKEETYDDMGKRFATRSMRRQRSLARRREIAIPTHILWYGWMNPS